MQEIKKWGFGSSPFTEKSQIKNRNALICVRNYLENRTLLQTDTLIESISHVKGMFNRIYRQDQWDWFTTSMYFDYPTFVDIRIIVDALSLLRVTILQKNSIAQEHVCEKLNTAHLNEYIDNYLNYNPNYDERGQYIYILSRKDEKELLKIGMTTRNVVRRCQEINSATGVVFPLSPRKVYRVTDAILAERVVHQALNQWRIRKDREFFFLDYKTATYIIERVLEDNQLFDNKYGSQITIPHVK